METSSNLTEEKGVAKEFNVLLGKRVPLGNAEVAEAENARHLGAIVRREIADCPGATLDELIELNDGRGVRTGVDLPFEQIDDAGKESRGIIIVVESLR